MRFYLFLGSKVALVHSAVGAGPIFGEVFKFGAGSNAVVGITDFGVINITTDFADVLHIHNLHNSGWKILSPYLICGDTQTIS